MGGLPVCNLTATLVLALCISFVIGRSCTTEKCQQAGNALLGNLNLEINACDDFYEHACGGWIAKNPLPNSEYKINQEYLLNTKIEQQLKELLEKKENSDTGAVKKAKDFYQSCVNEDVISDRGIAPLVSTVSANGGLPATLPSDQSGLSENFSLQKIFENYIKIGAYWPLLHIDITSNRRSQQKTLMAKWETNPAQIWRSFMVKADDSQVPTYKSYVKAVIQDFVKSGGFNVSSGDLDKDVEDIVTFETELWRAITSMGPRDTVTTLAEFQTKWNSAIAGHPQLAIDWLALTRISFSQSGVTIDETEKILLFPKDNFAAITSLLKRTSLRTIVNYIHWYVIYDSLRFTNVHKRIYGVNIFGARPKSCFTQLELVNAYSYIYVKEQRLNNNYLKTANDIVSQIQSEFKGQFDRSTLLNDNEKLIGKKNVDKIRKNIGYPTWYDESGKIDEYYKELTIGSNYYENSLNLRRFNEIKNGKTLREDFTPSEVPSFKTQLKFNDIYNSLDIPAGLLQLPLFDPEIPLSINYGSTGSSIGREIASEYLYGDVIENNEKVPWLSDSTIAGYNNKAKCFADQYSKYPISENNGTKIYVYGEGTAQYHIADNTGIKLALKGYLSEKAKKNFEAVEIPGLENFSDEQLFFYSVANLNCVAYDPKYAAEKLATTSRIRVNGALSNLAEFSNAFSCATGTPMNPEKKCALFD